MAGKTIKSIAKTFEILELLAQHENGLTLSVLSELQNAPANTVKGLLNTLIELGYVHQPSPRGPYAITSRFFLFTRNFTWERRFKKMIPGILGTVQKASGGELVVASLVNGMQFTEIERLPCMHGLGVTSHRGLSTKKNLHAFAQGRIILSTLSAPALAAYLLGQNLSAREAERIKKEIAATDSREVLNLAKSWEAGIHTLAAGVFDGSVLKATIAVNLPEFRCTQSTAEKTGAALRRAVHEIETAMDKGDYHENNA